MNKLWLLAAVAMTVLSGAGCGGKVGNTSEETFPQVQAGDPDDTGDPTPSDVEEAPAPARRAPILYLYGRTTTTAIPDAGAASEAAPAIRTCAADSDCGSHELCYLLCPAQKDAASCQARPDCEWTAAGACAQKAAALLDCHSKVTESSCARAPGCLHDGTKCVLFQGFCKPTTAPAN